MKSLKAQEWHDPICILKIRLFLEGGLEEDVVERILNGSQDSYSLVGALCAILYP